jgi:hypothetical protein
MSELQFINDLKISLKNYGDLDDELTILKIKKDEIRNNIENWMNMHNILEYDSFDINGKTLWRMAKSTSTRSTVNKEYLESILTPGQLQLAFNSSEIKMFKISKVKSKRKQSLTPPIGELNV